MIFFKLLITLIVTVIGFSVIPSPYVLGIGIIYFIFFILDEVGGNVEFNFFLLSIFTFFVALLWALLYLLFPQDGTVWPVVLYSFANLSTVLYMSKLICYNWDRSSWGTKQPRYFASARDLVRTVVYEYRETQLAAKIFFVVYILLALFFAYLVSLSPYYAFLAPGSVFLYCAVVYLILRLQGTNFYDSHSKYNSFSDVFRAVGEYFVRKGKEFINIFVSIFNFFKRLFTGELFKRKTKLPSKRKVARQNKAYAKRLEQEKRMREAQALKVKYRGYTPPKKKFRLPSFSFNPSALLFLISIAVCGFILLSYEVGWLSLDKNVFDDWNNGVHFVDGYGKWAEAVGDWLNPALEDLGTIPSMAAFIVYLPLTLAAYVLEGVWWLISWVIIGAIKLVLFIFAKIFFFLPFLICGGAIAFDVILFTKLEKEVSVVVFFIISLISSITAVILIIV